ncbi:MAG: alpha-glucosidase [Clostridiales bacterium]|nr:alpha-glucosidase [Clostridiales bacterium]
MKTTLSNKEKQILDTTVYQIYPRSFYDGNGDGVGDLQGIIQKIPHLKNLGINTVWLCPCYPSPNADNGYDVANYKDVNPLFGDMRDWERLKNRLHDERIKILMDFVANHTSDEHFFFQEAKKSKDNPYHEYYIWADKPNGWKSVFGGSAWTYNRATKEYYLHSFDKKQPDLNWKNQRVRKEMQSVIDFWTDKGVDGFRCDVLDFIAKDFEKNQMYGGALLPTYIKELFGRKHTRKLFTVGECQTNRNTICDICGIETGKLSTVFQFDHMRICGNDKFRPKRFSFEKLRKTLVSWQNFTQENKLIPTLFTDNHDYPYFISRYGDDEALRYFSATAYACACFLLRGIPFIYQGQEYGAINPYYEDISSFDDVETKNRYRQVLSRKGKAQAVQEINVGSRDNTRRPFAWNGNKDEHFGFSTATPWLQSHTRAADINLEDDTRAQFSVFAFYQKLLALRKRHTCLRYGNFTDITQNKNAFVYERVYGNKSAVIVCNYNQAQSISLPKKLVEKGYSLVLYNYPKREEAPFCPTFQPFETAVYIR